MSVMQSFLIANRRAADCGGSARSNATARGATMPAVARAIRQGVERARAPSPQRLSDHLLKDIGLTRADLQALSL